MEKLKFKGTVDLINDENIFKTLIIFSIPILISNVFQKLYNIADIVIVGSILGEKLIPLITSIIEFLRKYYLLYL